MTDSATTASEVRDYLVVCDNGWAGGTWARGPDLEDCVKRCRRMFHSDWKHLFKLDGVEVTLTLFDVTGAHLFPLGPLLGGPTGALGGLLAPLLPHHGEMGFPGQPLGPLGLDRVQVSAAPLPLRYPAGLQKGAKLVLGSIPDTGALPCLSIHRRADAAGMWIERAEVRHSSRSLLASPTMASTMAIRSPIQAITGTAMELPSAR